MTYVVLPLQYRTIYVIDKSVNIHPAQTLNDQYLDIKAASYDEVMERDKPRSLPKKETP